MKFQYFLAVCLLSVLPLTATQYMGLDFGSNHVEHTNNAKAPKVGAKVGIRYGYDFGTGIRTEFHVVHRFNAQKTAYTIGRDDQTLVKETSSVKSFAYMANAIYDISQIQMYTVIPYIGAGVGYCQNTEHLKKQYADFSGHSKLKDNRFAWQGIVGAKYSINELVSTALEYHYFCGKSHTKEHSFSVTMIRNF